MNCEALVDSVAVTELLTVPEAAALLRLKVSTVRAWVCQRKIPYVKLGGRLVRIRRMDAEAIIASGLVPVGVVLGEAQGDESR
jgi:excisionase family DNA binding protein